ncbi:transcriptional regulator, partial [Acinetobacter baumannii]
MDNLDSEASRMSPEELKQAGEILYGTQWQTELARAIDVDSSRVRQWMAEERPIPISLRSKIILLLMEKSRKS